MRELQQVLTFRKEELPELNRFLKQFPQAPLHQHESMRCVIDDCSVTLFESGKLVIQGKNFQRVSENVLAHVQSGYELVLGIDEAGRGESFGDLCIAGVLGKTRDLRELRDSKKTANVAQKKKIVAEKALAAVVISFSAASIDAFRLNGTNLNQLEAKAIDWLVDFFVQSGFAPQKIVVDGNPLPVQSSNLVFLPKADDLEPVVGAASVLAKASRDESNQQTVRKTWNKKQSRFL